MEMMIPVETVESGTLPEDLIVHFCDSDLGYPGMSSCPRHQLTDPSHVAPALGRAEPVCLWGVIETTALHQLAIYSARPGRLFGDLFDGCTRIRSNPALADHAESFLISLNQFMAALASATFRDFESHFGHGQAFRQSSACGVGTLHLGPCEHLPAIAYRDR